MSISKIKDILSLMRVSHYIKNFFIFLPLFFIQKIFEFELFYNTFLGFIAFSLCASSIYILNDIFDIKYDRRHPTKKDRPLASGKINLIESSNLISFIKNDFFLK